MIKRQNQIIERLSVMVLLLAAMSLCHLHGFAAAIEPVSPAVQKVVQGNRAFAADLYAQLRSQPGNLFFSPYSISTALAMTYAGARAETALQMAKTLHFPKLDNDVHPAFSQLEAGLNALQKDGSVELTVANSLWPQKKYPLLPAYLQLIKKFVTVHGFSGFKNKYILYGRLFADFSRVGLSGTGN